VYHKEPFILIEYRLTDVLDLTPHNSESSTDYDKLVAFLRPIYYDTLGGNRNL
jgi:hypothetical protein